MPTRHEIASEVCADGARINAIEPDVSRTASIMRGELQDLYGEDPDLWKIRVSRPLFKPAPIVQLGTVELIAPDGEVYSYVAPILR